MDDVNRFSLPTVCRRSNCSHVIVGVDIDRVRPTQFGSVYKGRKPPSFVFGRITMDGVVFVAVVSHVCSVCTERRLRINGLSPVMYFVQYSNLVLAYSLTE